MPRDAQILIVFFAILVGIGVYVLTDGKDLGVGSGQSAFVAAPPEAESAAPVQVGESAKCVEMVFFDAQGVVIPMESPLTGIYIGSTPLFEGTPPAFTRSGAGRSVPCPPALVASVQKTYSDFCTSSDLRAKAATANSTDLATINQRCADLGAALGK